MPAALKTVSVYVVVTLGEITIEPLVATLPNPVKVAETAFCELHERVVCWPLVIADKDGVIVQTGICCVGLTVIDVWQFAAVPAALNTVSV